MTLKKIFECDYCKEETRSLTEWLSFGSHHPDEPEIQFYQNSSRYRAITPGERHWCSYKCLVGWLSSDAPGSVQLKAESGESDG
jgi:hypothetical protein